jgi:xanthine dehydrogenase YagR molybdenum-binding subunit
MPAIRVTSVMARDALFAKVAPTLGAAAENLVAEGGRIFVKGTPSKGLAWKDACKLIGTEPISVDGQWEDGLSGSGTSGVQFAEATVDIETGIVRVTRILAIQDCGLIVDKLTAESQAYGGVIAAINFALFEDRILDRVTGQMVNPNMEMYLLAGMSDVPKIDIMLNNMPERGVIGIGEPPTISTAAAVGNAIFNAIGVRVFEAPFTPDRVLAALARRK